MSNTSRKVVVVGDGMVGKTALLHAYVKRQFQADYIPTVFETTAKEVDLTDGRRLDLGLWDTGGQEEFDQIRQLAYPGASLILLCYSVDSQTSLDNVIHTWLAEVKAYCPDAPIILVGCKSDQRTIPSRPGTRQTLHHLSPECIDPDMAEDVSRQIGARLHIECSAFTRANVDTVFSLAARFILDNYIERPRRFSIRRILSFKREKGLPNGHTSMSSVQSGSTGNKRNNSGAKLWCLANQS